MKTSEQSYSVEYHIEELIPHRGPMLFLERVLSADGKSMRCLAVVDETRLFLSDGVLESCALIEYMAQAMAAFVGYKGRLQGGANICHGYLVGARNVEFVDADIRVGDELVIEVMEEATLGDYGSYYGRVLHDGRRVCSGNLKVFRDRGAVAA